MLFLIGEACYAAAFRINEQNSYNNKKYVKDKPSTADKTSTLSDALASKDVQGVNTFLNQKLVPKVQVI